MAGRRVKPNRVTPVGTVEECDWALARIAQLQRELADRDARMNRKIDEEKNLCALAAAPLQDELLGLTNGIEAFGETHKAELFVKEKTRELPHGFIGFRQSSFISTTKKTLELLKQFGKKAAVKVTETIRKDVLLTWSDKDLAEVKAGRKTEDKFWFEVKEEEVARRGE